MAEYLYVLKLVDRLHEPGAWKDEDNQAVSDPFDRLEGDTAAGKVILAGRTDEPLDQTFGLVVFEASSFEEAQAYLDNDPTVARGVMTAVLHPYSVALLRGASKSE